MGKKSHDEILAERAARQREQEQQRQATADRLERERKAREGNASQQDKKPQ